MACPLRYKRSRSRSMDNMSWFDTYRGPKRLMVEPDQATCWIGFSVAMGSGGVMRKDLYTYGPTLTQALAEARAVYESIPNRLSVSNSFSTPRVGGGH